jgi:hypothetical protein
MAGLWERVGKEEKFISLPEHVQHIRKPPYGQAGSKGEANPGDKRGS